MIILLKIKFSVLKHKFIWINLRIYFEKLNLIEKFEVRNSLNVWFRNQ